MDDIAGLWLVGGLAFFLAWNLGANDVANAMGTSVGSKVITLRQAILLAGILELMGAVLFGHSVTTTLMDKVAPLQLFEGQPHLFELSVVAELLATSLWMLLATWRGWPVASSHAAVSAIASINLLAFGGAALQGSLLRDIGLCWLLTPLVSGLLAAGFYGILQRGLLTQPDAPERWQHWSPWISATVLGLVGGLVLPVVTEPIATLVQTRWQLSVPSHDYALGLGLVATLALTVWTSQPLPSDPQGDRLRIETDPLEQQLGKFQLVSAGCMAFAHGSNDVGNAVAPLAGFVTFWQTQTLPTGTIPVPLWTLGLGGIGIVLGLATWGKRVIATVGENLTVLQPSYGFCAELGAATTVLLASHWGLPVSTTHALIGSVVGIGWIHGGRSLQWGTVRQILAAWVVTVPAAMALAALLFEGLQRLTRVGGF